MSLAALVFRNLTVAALLGKTLADGNVRSSDLEPANEIHPGNVLPVVSVFTDSVKATAADIQGYDLLGANTTITLGIEIACMGRPPAGSDADDVPFIPQTDEGLEMTLDIIQRQALAELQTGESQMAELWRSCVMKFCGINVVRGAAIERGVRFAGRRVEIDAEIICDPYPGQAIPSTWAKIITAMKADDGLAQVGQTVETLASGATLPTWKQWRNELGMNDDVMSGIGLGPIDGVLDDDGEIIAATQISVEGDDATVTVDADEATIAQNDDPDNPATIVEADPDA